MEVEELIEKLQAMARLHPHYTVTIPDYDELNCCLCLDDVGGVEYYGEEITIRPESYYDRPFCAMCGEPIDGIFPPKKLEEMFCYALRYALGRMSYAPYSVVTFLQPLLPHIRSEELALWARDIEKQFPPEDVEALLGRRCEGYFEDFSYRLWMNFLESIRREEDRRKSK